MLWFEWDEIQTSIMNPTKKNSCHHLKVVLKCYEFGQVCSVVMEMIFRGCNARDVLSAAELRLLGLDWHSRAVTTYLTQTAPSGSARVEMMLRSFQRSPLSVR